MNRSHNRLQKFKQVVLGLLSTFVLILILTLLFDWVIMPLYTKRGAELELPDVTEKSFEEAGRLLTSKGFTVVKESKLKFDPVYPAGTVLSQNPLPFSHVKEGRRIYLTLSAGERAVEVPRLIGSSERDAEFRLKREGLTLGEVFYEYSTFFPSGVVSAQSVGEGDTLIEHTSVDITVSIGSIPGKFIVPDVMGKSLDTARKLIRQAGLRVGEITFEETGRFVPETVLNQGPAPKADVARGSEVDLVVSRLREEAPWKE
ncbi:MAG TPA: PASTA domain-containing protein [bacterium]|nr:PASTA domain-containing protein [bacterium]